MDPEFSGNEVLRDFVTRDSNSLRQQVELLGMYQHRQLHGVAIPGGGRRPRGVCEIRTAMLGDQIVAILTCCNLVYTKDNGERYTSGPIPTGGTITEFRSLFVYNLRRTCDPALSIITSRDGSRCVVICRCRKVLCEVLDISPQDLERYFRIPYPPEMEQPVVRVTCGPDGDEVRIIFKTHYRTESGPLTAIPSTADCTCGHHLSRSGKRRRRGRPSSVVDAVTPSTTVAQTSPTSEGTTAPESVEVKESENKEEQTVVPDAPIDKYTTVPPSGLCFQEGTSFSPGYCAHPECRAGYRRREAMQEWTDNYHVFQTPR